MLDYLDELTQNWPPLLAWSMSKIYNGVLAPLRTQERLFWGYLLVAVLLALAVYLYRRRFYPDEETGSLLKFLLPKRIYTHPSALVDCKIFLLNGLLRPFTGVFTTLLSATLISILVARSLLSLLPPPNIDLGEWRMVICTAIFFMALDFGTFLNHWMHHRSRVLWPIHRLHHTAEVLTPVTAYRNHPLWYVIRSFVRGPVAGIVQGITIFLFAGEVSTLNILGLNAVYFFYHALGSNLRHSHIWLSYGPVLNRILISPAQHQIHHSVAPEHQNCNFGGVLAIWDLLWGTLVLPTEEIRRNLVLGVAEDAPQLHPTLRAGFFEPARESWRRLVTRRE